MAKPFEGVINVDIRDSAPDWAPFEPPKEKPYNQYPNGWAIAFNTPFRMLTTVQPCAPAASSIKNDWATVFA
jgi:hypothetical protein